MTPPVSSSKDRYSSCEVAEDFDNTKQIMIHITQDKLENYMLKHINKVNSYFKWVEPLAIFLTLIIAQLTTEFKDRWNIPKQTWEAFFFFLTIASLIWLAFSIVQSLRSITISKLVDKIRNPEG